MLQGFSLFVDVAQSLCAPVPSPVVATSDNGGAATHMAHGSCGGSGYHVCTGYQRATS
eukprot:CAMPEP_0181231944 /NCGR_PEP_ID=MMETSP1096-20121128/35420_1 /TAXON_ID=156174 ORGANISM="Chrysochromulina ericina, Strain CCMP281" /NCGR_SAMPLE_ID=MMETSP1096 /ASSEMBLY_ACC=CAM_ASM_000453 /LENGTH=57 /DNA_ID=CAMNT_0023326107 /DNA_START=103 /DNA_END=276 /DNA_ORIENTATION=+